MKVYFSRHGCNHYACGNMLLMLLKLAFNYLVNGVILLFLKVRSILWESINWEDWMQVNFLSISIVNGFLFFKMVTAYQTWIDFYLDQENTLLWFHAICLKPYHADLQVQECRGWCSLRMELHAVDSTFFDGKSCSLSRFSGNMLGQVHPSISPKVETTGPISLLFFFPFGMWHGHHMLAPHMVD